MQKQLIVTKAGGQRVPFSREKLEHSLRVAGADTEQIEEIIASIMPKLYDGVTTRKLYRWAFDKLKQRSKNLAAKYKLKKAIMELGPDGFIFERFIAEILRRQGYRTKIGVIVQGKCITHEIDVLASKNEELMLVECKYHSLQGKLSDVKVPLYINSRFQDVKSQWLTAADTRAKSMKCRVVTNTRFSPDATTYALCVGIELLGWDFPVQHGIKELIDEFRLYPITCLSTLTRTEKDQLLAANVLLCSELDAQSNVLDMIRLSNTRKDQVLAEVQGLM